MKSRGTFDRRSTWDTPTLIECWRTAPYLHDGRYTTVRDVLARGNHGDVADRLSDAQIDALIAYLRFLGTSKHRLMGNPETGYDLYQRYCQVCHGEDGGGDGIMTNLIKMRPTDHSNPIAMARLSNDELVNSIRDGTGEYMPAWKDILTQDEVEALVSYIRLLAQ